MIEIFALVTIVMAFIFFSISSQLRGDWENLQFLFFGMGFLMIIFSSALIGVIASNSDVSHLGFSFMWINILVFIVVLFFFIIMFIKRTAESIRVR